MADGTLLRVTLYLRTLLAKVLLISLTFQAVVPGAWSAASDSQKASSCRSLWSRLQDRMPRLPLPRDEAAKRLNRFLEEPGEGFGKYLEDAESRRTRGTNHSDPMSEVRMSSEKEKVFHDDLKTVIDLMGDLKQIDAKHFRKWLDANWNALATQPVIRAYAKEGKKLPIFVHEAYFRYLLSEGLHSGDKNKVIEAALRVIENPYLRLFSAKTVKLAFAVVGMVWTTIYFSALPGTFGRIIGSVTNNMVGPIAEKAEQWSNVHMTGPATWIRQSLEGTSNEDLKTRNEELEQTAEEAKKKLDDLSNELAIYDYKMMTRDQAKKNFEKLKNQWIDFGQYWVKTFPPYVREGRRLATEYALDFPGHYATAFSTHDTNGELHRQGLEQQLSRLQSQGVKREDLLQLKELFRSLIEKAREGHPPDSLEQARELNPDEGFEGLVQKLKDSGATEADLNEMFRHLAQIEKSDDAIAGVAASIVFQDFIYPENYRIYPAEEKKLFDAIRDRYGYEYYMARVTKKLVKTIRQMGMEIDYRLAEEQLKLMGTAIARKKGVNPAKNL